MIKLILASLFLLALDIYVSRGFALINTLTAPWSTITRLVYWIISLLLIGQFLNLFSHWHDYRVNSPEFVRFWSSIFFVVLFAKLVFIFFILLGDILSFSTRILHFFTAKSSESIGKPISRGLFVRQVGLGISALFLGAFAYGIVKGRYAFRVIRQKIKFTNLPKAFEGFKIVQISDLHLGSFINDFEQVAKVVPMINDLKPDIIVFTGDMVNVHSDEAEPWINIFAQLKAKYGKYAVFGNHDYCDYGDYTKAEKQQSIDRLKEIHHEMGFTLLEDEHQFLEIDKDKIALVGMHNWGKDFHQVGDLDKALQGLNSSDFKILLSHDPSLWEKKILTKKAVELTLSGHTHGMQMGLEIPALAIKWSPVALRYKRWAGLYGGNNKYLYINRGFGVLGFPGRLGMDPEITLIELMKQ
jgi:predicted MPP superfamily phosphohydrolase